MNKSILQQLKYYLIEPYIREDVAYFKERIKELCDKAAQAEEGIRKKIENAGEKGPERPVLQMSEKS
jgi:hypothetical protein